MRVPLILKDIEMRTEDLTDREIITNIIEVEEAHLRELDDKMKWLKNFERLLEIQRNILWPSVTDLDPKVFIPEVRFPILLIVQSLIVKLFNCSSWKARFQSSPVNG